MVDQHPEIEQRVLRKGQSRRERERRAHEGHSHFAVGLYSEPRASELRKKHLSEGLSTYESVELLALGNMEHVAELKTSVKRTGDSPLLRHQRIINGQADYLVVKCSDARIAANSTIGDPLVGIEVRIAGNVVPGRKSASSDAINQAISQVKKDGLVLVAGHIHCGAVKERVKWVDGGMKDTGAKELDSLLHEVMGPDPEANAIAQLEKLRRSLDVGTRSTGALIYDWEHDGAKIVSENTPPIMQLYVDSFNRRHNLAFEEGHLHERLEAHKPHVIAIGTTDLPYSVAAIFNARQNEVFSTTGSESGLHEMDKASILYAIEHLGVRHITLTAPGLGSEHKGIGKMFNRWEADLRAMEVDGKPVIANLLDSGKLKITRIRYDLESGKAIEV